MSEGHVPIDKDGNGIIVCTSYWEKREDAENALTRKFSASFGSWKPRRRWIVEVNDANYDSHLTSIPA
jgi:hypothetical protein